MRITIEEIEKLLTIDKSNLDLELERHAEIQHEISKLIDTSAVTAADLKDKLDKKDAALFTLFSEEDPKLAIEKIKNKIKLDRDRDVLHTLYFKEQVALESLNRLLDSWRSKSFSLKALCELYCSDYFTTDSVSSDPNIRTIKLEHFKGKPRQIESEEPSKEESKIEETPKRKRMIVEE